MALDETESITSMNYMLAANGRADVKVSGIARDVVTVQCPSEYAAAERGYALRVAQGLLRDRWHRGFRVQLEPSADINSMRRLRGIVDIEAV